MLRKTIKGNFIREMNEFLSKVQEKKMEEIEGLIKELRNNEINLIHLTKDFSKLKNKKYIKLKLKSEQERQEAEKRDKRNRINQNELQKKSKKILFNILSQEIEIITEILIKENKMQEENRQKKQVQQQKKLKQKSEEKVVSKHQIIRGGSEQLQLSDPDKPSGGTTMGTRNPNASIQFKSKRSTSMTSDRFFATINSNSLKKKDPQLSGSFLSSKIKIKTTHPPIPFSPPKDRRSSLFVDLDVCFLFFPSFLPSFIPPPFFISPFSLYSLLASFLPPLFIPPFFLYSLLASFLPPLFIPPFFLYSLLPSFIPPFSLHSFLPSLFIPFFLYSLLSFPLPSLFLPSFFIPFSLHSFLPPLFIPFFLYSLLPSFIPPFIPPFIHSSLFSSFIPPFSLYSLLSLFPSLFPSLTHSLSHYPSPPFFSRYSFSPPSLFLPISFPFLFPPLLFHFSITLFFPLIPSPFPSPLPFLLFPPSCISHSLFWPFFMQSRKKHETK